MIRLLRLLALAMVLFPVFVFAKTYDVTSKGEYVMGDNDTKIEARRLALEQAKRLAVEQIGTYLESETVVKNCQLEKDEIRSYASAILKVKVINENINLLSDKTTVFTINILANVDTSMLEHKISELKSDKQRNQQLLQLQIENKKLLKDIEDISRLMKNAKTEEYKKFKNQRESLFYQLDSNQKSISLTFERGELLDRSMKSKGEIDQYINNIDEFIKYYVDNIKFKLGEPQVQNFGAYSKLLIPLEVDVDNSSNLLKMAENFSKKSSLKYGNVLSVREMMSYNPSELNAYIRDIDVLLQLKIGSNKVYVIVYSNNSNSALKSNTLLNIKLATAELSKIGSIDADIIHGKNLCKSLRKNVKGIQFYRIKL